LLQDEDGEMDQNLLWLKSIALLQENKVSIEYNVLLYCIFSALVLKMFQECRTGWILIVKFSCYIDIGHFEHCAKE
jgi:hypothetical protein